MADRIVIQTPNGPRAVNGDRFATLKAWCHWQKKNNPDESTIELIKDIEELISDHGLWKTKAKEAEEKIELLTSPDDHGREYAIVCHYKDVNKKLLSTLQRVNRMTGLPDAAEACRTIQKHIEIAIKFST